MPVGRMVSPGRTGRKVDAAPNQNIENNPMQSRNGSLARMLAHENILTRRANHWHYSKIVALAR